MTPVQKIQLVDCVTIAHRDYKDANELLKAAGLACDLANELVRSGIDEKDALAIYEAGELFYKLASESACRKFSRRIDKETELKEFLRK